jgi:hypothetical protein
MSGKGIEKVREINQEWIKQNEEDPQLCTLVYEPFTEEYWAEKYKIVWCNLEPGGSPEDKNEKVLSLKSYRTWLEKRNPTIKNTSRFIYCLYNKLNGNIIDENKLEAVKGDYDILIDCMKKVTYMNLIKDVGSPELNKQYLKDYFSIDKYPENNERTINMIKALNPNIFIITGDGKDIIEKLYNKKFDEKHSFVNDNILFISLGHPRSWWRGYIYPNVDMIYDNLIRYRIT